MLYTRHATHIVCITLSFIQNSCMPKGPSNSDRLSQLTNRQSEFSRHSPESRTKKAQCKCTLNNEPVTFIIVKNTGEICSSNAILMNILFKTMSALIIRHSVERLNIINNLINHIYIYSYDLLRFSEPKKYQVNNFRISKTYLGFRNRSIDLLGLSESSKYRDRKVLYIFAQFQLFGCFLRTFY